MQNLFTKKKLKPTSSHYLSQVFWRFARNFLSGKSWTFFYQISQKKKFKKLIKLIDNTNFDLPNGLITVFTGDKDLTNNKKLSTLLIDNNTSKPNGSYLDFLDKEAEKFKNKRNFILEIGIAQGSGLIALKDYFHQSKILGFDIDAETFIKHKRIECLKFDQLNLETSKKTMQNINLGFDLIIDDGWHHPEASVKTLCSCLKYLNYGGTYIIEDIVDSQYNNFFLSISDILKLKGFETEYFNFYSELKNTYGMSGVLKITRKIIQGSL
jgi:hypothetical protein